MRTTTTIPLDVRKQGILKAVVIDYVHTAEPVGSHALAARHQFGVRSATIRNELAELAELGYLRQPHTSAGRIPSDQGYRFYVDRLMDPATLAASDTSARRPAQPTSEVEIIISETCKLLSRLSRYTSLATHPAVKDASISFASVARVGRGKMLAVVVLDNGCVIHELLEFGGPAREPDPIGATAFLQRHLQGRTLEAACAAGIDCVPEDAADMKEVLGRILQFLASELDSTDEADIHLEGTGYIVQQPEFRDLEKLEAVLSVLEERSALRRLLSSIFFGPDVTVVIGSENPMGEMRNCSFVGARYRIRGRAAGTIGVVGPTRMDYPRAVGAVELMARSLGQLLTQLCVS